MTDKAEGFGLLPCPFCESGDVEKVDGCSLCGTETCVRCRACGAIAFEEYWNTRPTPQPEGAVDLLKEIVADFKDFSAKASLTQLSDDIMDGIDEPDVVLERIAKVTKELCRERRVSTDIVLSEGVNDVIDRYESNRDRDGLQGIPYPWSVLNAETQGMQDGEFILFYGRPKSMKTWVLLRVATFAYDFAARRVLVYTREMTPAQMMDRSICLITGAPYAAFKKGTLHEIPCPEGGTMEDRFYAVADTMYSDEETCEIETGFRKSLIITSDRDDPKGGGVNGLRQKVDDHKPDLICADALYLMRNDRAGKRSVKWDDQAAITQDLKDLALDASRPLVGTTQANRPSEDARGKSMANIAFADSYAMDCDLAAEINKKATADPERNELLLAITGAREVNMTGFAIHGNAATDFTQMRRKVFDAAGVVVSDAEGNALTEPVVFYETREIKEFFKEQTEERKRTSSNSALAGWAGESFSKSGRSG